MEQKYEYEFCLWPHTNAIERMTLPLHEDLNFVFRMMQKPIQMDWTEAEFKTFRDELFRFGFEMHEVARRPKVKMETVL